MTQCQYIKTKMSINLILFTCLVLVYIPRIKAQGEKPTTFKTIIIETTTEVVTIITDIPQSDVEIALKHDYGRYTTMLFNYFNSQYDKAERHERCFNDYTKCLITQGVMTPVCVVNNPEENPHGYSTYNSYCDVYFDNCLRTMRFWRILGVGKCSIYQSGYFIIDRTRKKIGFQPKKYF